MHRQGVSMYVCGSESGWARERPPLKGSRSGSMPAMPPIRLTSRVPRQRSLGALGSDWNAPSRSVSDAAARLVLRASGQSGDQSSLHGADITRAASRPADYRRAGVTEDPLPVILPLLIVLRE